MVCKVLELLRVYKLQEAVQKLQEIARTNQYLKLKQVVKFADSIGMRGMDDESSFFLKVFQNLCVCFVFLLKSCREVLFQPLLTVRYWKCCVHVLSQSQSRGTGEGIFQKFFDAALELLEAPSAGQRYFGRFGRWALREFLSECNGALDRAQTVPGAERPTTPGGHHRAGHRGPKAVRKAFAKALQSSSFMDFMVSPRYAQINC